MQQNPQLKICLSEDVQKVFLDGECDLGPVASAAISADVALIPKPLFHFATKIAFTEHLEFDLDTLGDLDGVKCSEMNFALRADLRQDILEYVAAHAETYFKTRFRQ